MRSQIACARCRRSKVKCVNNGINTTCRACETSGRECTYPAPAAGGVGSLTRRTSMVGAVPGEGAVHGETPRRRPARRSVATTTHSHPIKESHRAPLNALDPQLLTSTVWTELFDIFQQHFSTDLPFLHKPTFLQNIRQSSLQNTTAEPGTAPSPSSYFPSCAPPLLLAFLALTARFHPAIVAHHSSNSSPNNPIKASQYYATAARSKLSGVLGEVGEGLGAPTLERVQALLMLGLHDWGMCQGAQAWISIGVAIRSAQVLGLQFEQEFDDMPMARSLALNDEIRHMGVNPDRLGRSTMLSNKSDEFIEQEIRRRTFWSCFIMDRYLSSGKYRPSMLNIQDLRIQLPSSERAFLFGEKVRTGLLGCEVGNQMRNQRNNVQGPDVQNNVRWEVGEDEGALSCFIRALDFYGTVVKWSCAGGRRPEQYPPWDERSKFYSLQSQLTAFKESLPRHLTLTPQNTAAHNASRTSTPYTLMHTVHLLCSIMLHREYVPFIPLRCRKPQGPLDPPLFPPEEYDIPPGFWDDSARQCFKAARDLIDLLLTCQEWQVLVETPIVGFALYTVAFVGVYCRNFPWMDPNGYMCKCQAEQPDGTRVYNTSGAEATGKAVQLISQIRNRLKMAEGWVQTIKRVHHYFVRITKDFRRNTRALEASSESGSSNDSYRYLSLREGGAGGGLEEYKLFEKVLKEFGSLEDEDYDMVDATSEGTARLGHDLDEHSEAGSAAIKSEGMEMVEGTPDSHLVGHSQERWNAINSGVTTTSQGADAPTSNGRMQQPHSYHQPVASPTQSTPMSHPDFRLPFGSPTMSNQPNLHVLSYPPNAAESAQRASLNLQHTIHHQPGVDVAQQQAQTAAAQQQAKWVTKDAFLNSLQTHLGGDDLAAFVAGDSWPEWVTMQTKEQGFSWLSEVWEHPSG